MIRTAINAARTLIALPFLLLAVLFAAFMIVAVLVFVTLGA